MAFTEPVISVITVSFNAAKTISKTIKSVASQTYQQVEYIVIDGASTDGTLEILETLREEIDILVSEPDSGIYNAMNKGARLASGNYLLFLNADDYLFSAETLALIVTRMGQLGEADIFYGDLLNFDPETGKASVWKSRIANAENLYRSTLPHPATLVGRECFNQLGGYDEQMKISADHDLFVRALVRGKHFAYLDMLVSVFRLGGVSTSGNFKRLLQDERDSSIRQNFARMQRLRLKMRVRLRKVFGI